MSDHKNDSKNRRRHFWMAPPEGAAAVFHDWRIAEKELDEVFASDSRFQSVIDPIRSRQVSYRSELAQTKRFGERLRCDREFRERLIADPKAVANEYGFEIDVEALRPFWDTGAAEEMAEDPTFAPSLAALRHRLFAREKLLHREKVRTVECVPDDERQRVWRNRQINRCLGELGPVSYQGIVHAPFAIELSDGCSVGCWFCGVSAERKKTDFLYTEENASLWRGILRVLRSKLGPSASAGFCYWATDPLDNPDYEKFCVDFSDICNRFPQTTTAQPHKDPERVRSLLRLSQERGCTINRFSILTLRIFNRIMDEFSPEELLHCELVPQNPESRLLQSDAGRALKSRRLQDRKKASGWSVDTEMPPGTIACVSGFLINMVTRNIRLITPCAASERWPEGYWVLSEGTFEDSEEFEELIEKMLSDSMRTSIRASDFIRTTEGSEIEIVDDGFAVKRWGARTTFKGARYLPALGKILSTGGATAGELALGMEKRFGTPLHEVLHGLNKIFDAGVLDETPRTMKNRNR